MLIIKLSRSGCVGVASAIVNRNQEELASAIALLIGFAHAATPLGQRSASSVESMAKSILVAQM